MTDTVLGMSSNIMNIYEVKTCFTLCMQDSGLSEVEASASVGWPSRTLGCLHSLSWTIQGQGRKPASGDQGVLQSLETGTFHMQPVTPSVDSAFLNGLWMSCLQSWASVLLIIPVLKSPWASCSPLKLMFLYIKWNYKIIIRTMSNTLCAYVFKVAFLVQFSEAENLKCLQLPFKPGHSNTVGAVKMAVERCSLSSRPFGVACVRDGGISLGNVYGKDPPEEPLLTMPFLRWVRSRQILGRPQNSQNSCLRNN